MPGVVCVLVMMEGFEVRMRSRMLPDSMRVGSFTMFCNPNSLIISSSPSFEAYTVRTSRNLYRKILLEHKNIYFNSE